MKPSQVIQLINKSKESPAKKKELTKLAYSDLPKAIAFFQKKEKKAEPKSEAKPFKPEGNKKGVIPQGK